MKISEIQDILEAWAPREIAWEDDNVGLQIGSPSTEVERVLVALEISPDVIDEAKRKRIDLIITHHPLLFKPLKSVTDSTDTGTFTYRLIRSDIAVYSAHTNLDFTRGGVSFALAEQLGLSEVDFLHRTSGFVKKISVFVPPEHVDAVAKEMANAGAGVIGDYEKCSFRVDGTGTFQPQKGASPYVGTVGNFEKVPEVRLEMIVPSWRVPAVVARIIQVHPYEEVAYDVYPLENQPHDYGAGAIGSLKVTTTLRQYLGRIKNALGAQHLRFTGDPASRVQRVAVCGGAGGSLLSAAIEAKADLFVTADVKYHTFQEARDKIALVDAGHYETERPVLDVVAKRLQETMREKGEKVKVFLTSTVTSPVFYH